MSTFKKIGVIAKKDDDSVLDSLKIVIKFLENKHINAIVIIPTVSITYLGNDAKNILVLWLDLSAQSIFVKLLLNNLYAFQIFSSLMEIRDS